MSTVKYKTGGALTDEDSDIYIDRVADNEALSNLLNMNYLLLIEPRQQGKTSLINRLIHNSVMERMVFSYIDVTTPERTSAKDWYNTLCPRILSQLSHIVPRNKWPYIPNTSVEWRDFLYQLSILADKAGFRIVIALDEIGAARFPGATNFFSVMRDIFNSRQIEKSLRRLTFILSGCFHPRDLIKDDNISPFNIANRVRLLDFTPEHVIEIVNRGIEKVNKATSIADRIFYWTGGQPYLTQWICSYLQRHSSINDVDMCIEYLRREDENHLPSILEHLKANKKLSQYITKLQSGERIKFYPRENKWQAQLELLSLLKSDKEGFCVIRNRVYDIVLRNAKIVKMDQNNLKPFERADNININSDTTLPDSSFKYPEKNHNPLESNNYLLSHIIKTVKLLRPKFYNTITLILVTSGISLMSTPLIERIVNLYLKKEYNLQVTDGVDPYWGISLILLGLIFWLFAKKSENGNQ